MCLDYQCNILLINLRRRKGNLAVIKLLRDFYWTTALSFATIPARSSQAFSSPSDRALKWYLKLACEFARRLGDTKICINLILAVVVTSCWSMLSYLDARHECVLRTQNHDSHTSHIAYYYRKPVWMDCVD